MDVDKFQTYRQQTWKPIAFSCLRVKQQKTTTNKQTMNKQTKICISTISSSSCSNKEKGQGEPFKLTCAKEDTMGCGFNQFFGRFTWREAGTRLLPFLCQVRGNTYIGLPFVWSHKIISDSGLIKTGCGYNKFVLVGEFCHQEVLYFHPCTLCIKTELKFVDFTGAT